MPIPLIAGGAVGRDADLNPAELTKCIQWQSPQVDADTGQQTGEWTDQGDDWAKIEPLAGKELFLAMQVAPRVTHRVTAAYRDSVAPDWRIVYRGRIFHIDRVINVMEEDTKLELLCIESPQPTI